MLQCVARVLVLIEVPLSQPWPPNATVDEVHRNAEREAIEKIERVSGHPFLIVGKPSVQIVTSRRVKE